MKIRLNISCLLTTGFILTSCSTKKTTSTTLIVPRTDTVVGEPLELVPSSIDQIKTSPQQEDDYSIRFVMENDYKYFAYKGNDYNKCFENSYEGFVYTDTLITKTEKGNFFKKRSISDDEFVWSCGRGHIEKIIDTFPCNRQLSGSLRPPIPLFDWETEEFIALVRKCGTCCWVNIIVPVSSDKPILYLSYSAIDFEKMNVVSVGEEYFSVTNLRTQKSVEVPIGKIECVKGYFLFSVKEITLKGNVISFTVECNIEANLTF